MRLAGGAACVLLAFSLAVAAQAAELPTMKPPPTAPLKKCNVGGMAGVAVPGGVCVKVGGYVAAGAHAGNVKP